MQLADGSQMSLGAESKAMVESFEYHPAQSGSAAVGKAMILMRLGKLAYQTGDMPKGMTRIETPSADVTLHGTEIEMQVNARGYTHIDVAQGSIQVRSKYTGETAEIGAGESVSIFPDGIRDGHTPIDRPTAYSVENRRNDRGGTSDGSGRSGNAGGNDSGSDSGGDSDGGSDGGDSGGGGSGGGGSVGG